MINVEGEVLESGSYIFLIDWIFFFDGVLYFCWIIELGVKFYGE